MTDVIYPGFYKLNQIMLYSAPFSENKIATDIRQLVASISITESINNDSIRGSIEMVDTGGLLEQYPIRGEERIYIEIEDCLKNIQRYYCFVYRIDNIEIAETNDKIFYTLQFVTYQRFLADTKKITASYNDTVSNIVQDIFNRNYRQNNSTRPAASSTVAEGDPNKQIILETTDGIHKCIIPHFTPFQAIKFLEGRAYSSTSTSCSFRFFERTDAFYFVTDEYLYNLAQQTGKIFEFTSAEYISSSGSSLFYQMTNMREIKNIERVDVFDDIHGGGYQNKVIVLDIVNRTANMKQPAFSYIDNKSKYADSTIVDKHTDSFATANFTTDNARRFMTVKDYVDDNSGQLRGEQYIPEIVSNRLAYRKQLQSMKVTSKSHGRFDITCGDFIDLAIPDYVAAGGGSKGLNNQMSGVYLVETITRKFSVNDTFTNTYTLLKRGWSQQVDPNGNIALINGDVNL